MSRWQTQSQLSENWWKLRADCHWSLHRNLVLSVLHLIIFTMFTVICACIWVVYFWQSLCIHNFVFCTFLSFVCNWVSLDWILSLTTTTGYVTTSICIYNSLFLYLCICVFVYLCICVSRVYLCIVCSAEVGRRPQWRWCRSHQNHQLHQLACIRHTVSTLRARRTGWDPRWAMSVASLRFSQDSVPYGHWYCAPGCFQSTSSCTGVSPNTIGIVWSFKLDEASRCSANKDF